MPIYTYRCESCGVQFERHQSFSDEPLKRCPECSKNSLRKVLTPAGIIFKGSGWYATDHKSPSGQGRLSAKGEGKEKTESASASEGSSSTGSGESSGSEKKAESASSSSKTESTSSSTSKTESSSKASE